MATPARRQYLQIKGQYPDALLLYQVGDFYETFDEDARIAARELQIVLTARHYGEERVPLAGIPLHALDTYAGKLVARGYRVAICDQLSPGVQPAGRGETAGEAPLKGVVERAVTRILTAGTLSDPTLLPARQNNYLAAVAEGRTQIGLAAVDVSTGEFSVTWFSREELPAALEAELQRLSPAECLLQEAMALPCQLSVASMTLTPCPAYFFEPEAARERLCEHFHTHSLEAYGCARAPLAVAAAGAIVAYLQGMNARLLSLLTALRSYQTTSYMVLDAHTQRNLDLLQHTREGMAQGSLLGVLDQTITPMGARLLRRALTRPLLDLAELQARLQSVEELYEDPALRNRLTDFFQHLGDMERIAARIRQGTALPREVLGLREYLQGMPQLADVLHTCHAPLLRECIQRLDDCPEGSELIRRALTRADAEEQEGDGRLIRAGFHAELDELIAAIADSRRWMLTLEARERERTGLNRLKVGFNRVSGYYIEVSNARLSQVPGEYIRKQTLTNAERFITPEMKEHEARILSAEERIAELERSIYADVLQQLGVHYERLIMTAGSIALLDMLVSLAEVAARRGYTRPVLDQSGEIEILGGRHPVVECMLDGATFIPNDACLSIGESEEEARILLLTGPNMAGKSTYLRQVALIVLLAQLGSFVPARSARIGLVDRIFTRVGAEDDLASGKSTFMVEMEETATILHHASRRSLIVLDEIGRGTSTYDGLAIARAVVEYLHTTIGARTLFATHYHELAVMAAQLPHLRVSTMAISARTTDTIVFLHRVVPGCLGRSYGVHVARLAGMPGSVVCRAGEILQRLEAEREQIQRLLLTQADGEAAGPRQENWPRAGDRTPGEQASADLFSWLDGLDVSSMTPLDALKLLFAMQQQRREAREGVRANV